MIIKASGLFFSFIRILPLCPTEITEFSKEIANLSRLVHKSLGVSIDSVFSLKACG